MLWLLACLALLPAAYAHYRLPEYSEGRAALWATRIFLVMLGLGLGWATSERYFSMISGWPNLWLFLTGFGLAHIPAAAVLFLKHLRRYS